MRRGMPRTIDRARAARLYAKLGSYNAVAREMGHSSAGIMRALNPERAREYARRAEARPERKAGKRRWERENERHPCPVCGDLMGVGSHRKSSRCVACKAQDDQDRLHERALKLEAMWNEGLSMGEIQAHFGWTRGHLSVEMYRCREQGYDLPYRHKGFATFPHLVSS